jgi:NAD(P)-dependent dehydrogenase (short-subunit alcohol dehydrogenase family)
VNTPASIRGWTTEHIADLTGQVVVVTGANSGIGFQTALELARHGADVVLACRNQAKGRDAVDRIRAEHPAATVELEELDLADLSSVEAFASRLVRARPAVDVLVNNAGVMAIPRARTADGFEMQFGTNHLGHFALTGRLLPLLLARGGRVVTVSSTAHVIGHLDVDDLQRERHYSRWRAYGQSKLANLLFALELDRRARTAGAPLTSVAAHPGYAATNLTKPGSEGNTLMQRVFGLADRLVAQSDVEGARPTLYAATAPDLDGGAYIGPSALFGMRGAPARAWMTPAARSADTARRLWAVSEELTGVHLDLEAVARR